MVAVVLRYGVVLEDARHGVAGETYMVSPGFAAALVLSNRAALAGDAPSSDPHNPPVGPPVVPLVDLPVIHKRRR